MADGVSACSRAREAAWTCTESFITDYLQTPSTWTVKRSARTILDSLNRWFSGQTGDQGGYSQMICTISALIFKSTSGFLFHAGDTRIYRLQNNSLEQLTQDHSLRHGRSSVLTRALGIDAHLEIDYCRFELTPGDLFMFSSDGLHEFLDTQTLRQQLKQATDLKKTADILVQKALENGSNDNLSCLLVRVEETAGASPEEHLARLQQLSLPPALEPGMMLEGLRVTEVLFQGTRSSVFRVQNTENGKVYALKTPSAYFADDPVYLHGFMQEEWIGQNISAPNLMKIYPRPAESRFMYHICEFIEGQTLREWQQQHPAPSLQNIIPLMEQIIKGLRVLQRNDIRHNDIKPENIVILKDGQVRIIDFGAARVAALEEADVPCQEEVPQGSVQYIAPEQLCGDSCDFRADLFSTAVVCYELLAGRRPYPPFRYKNYIPSSYQEWHYQPLTEQRPDLPAWLDLCLKKALQPDPEKRYQAYSEFLTDLKKPLQPGGAPVPPRPLTEQSPLRIWKVLSAILGLVILAQFWLLLTAC